MYLLLSLLGFEPMMYIQNKLLSDKCYNIIKSGPVLLNSIGHS